MPPRVFCCKSAEIVERNGDDVFSIAKEGAKRVKECGGGGAWRVLVGSSGRRVKRAMEKGSISLDYCPVYMMDL